MASSTRKRRLPQPKTAALQKWQSLLPAAYTKPSWITHLNAFITTMTPYQKAWLGGSALVGVIGLVLALTDQKMPAVELGLLCCAMMVRVCYFAFANEHAARLNTDRLILETRTAADEVIAEVKANAAIQEEVLVEICDELEKTNDRLIAENYALQHPPVYIEMRGAHLEAVDAKIVKEVPESVDWALVVHLFVTPSVEVITIPLHYCEMTVCARITDQNRVEVIKSGKAGFVLMFGVIDLNDPENTGGVITIDTPRQITLLCETTAQGHISLPPEELTATLKLRDARDAWSKTLTFDLDALKMEKKVKWVAWPDLPRQPIVAEISKEVTP